LAPRITHPHSQVTWLTIGDSLVGLIVKTGA
jgi:hypothetical protein